MRDVTDAAPFCLDGQMLENPWASLFRMAFETCIVVELIPLPKACSCPCPMRSMTIRTLQCSLHHLMP
jgi:hypothetical protein